MALDNSFELQLANLDIDAPSLEPVTFDEDTIGSSTTVVAAMDDYLESEMVGEHGGDNHKGKDTDAFDLDDFDTDYFPTRDNI